MLSLRWMISFGATEVLEIQKPRSLSRSSDLSRGIVVELRSSRQELVSQELDQRLRPTPNRWLKAEPSWDTFGLSCGPAVPWQWWLHSTRQGMITNEAALSATDVAPISLHLNSAAPKRLYQFQDLILKNTLRQFHSRLLQVMWPFSTNQKS